MNEGADGAQCISTTVDLGVAAPTLSGALLIVLALLLATFGQFKLSSLTRRS